MKLAFLILPILAFSYGQLIAQVRKTYKVNPGEKVMQALPNEALYMYPQFKDATVNFKNGRAGSSKLNYNRLLDEIQFINKEDTLSLGDEETISSIYIDKDTFYYFQGFVKKMDDVKNVRFASKKVLGLSNKQRLGGMGELSSASIETYEKISSSQGMKEWCKKRF